jgi:hypothetical protein
MTSAKFLVCPVLHKAVPVHIVKAYGVAEVQLHLFLTSTLSGYEKLTSRFGRSPPERELPVPIGGWVGLRSVQEALDERKIYTNNAVPTPVPIIMIVIC